MLLFAGYFVLLYTVLRHLGARNREQWHTGKTIAAVTGILFLMIALMNVSNAYFEYSGVGETLWIMLALSGATVAVKGDEYSGEESR